MSTEQNKTISRRVLEEVWNKGNLAVIDETSAPNLVNHSTPPGIPAGREGSKQFAKVYRAAFPDLHFTIDDMLAEGDKVVTRWTVTGTHKGELFGMPATGKKATVTGMTIARYDATGKEAEVWANFDQLGLLQQLGVVPTPAPSKNYAFQHGGCLSIEKPTGLSPVGFFPARTVSESPRREVMGAG